MTRKSSRLRQSRSSQGRKMASLKSPREVLPQRRILCRPSSVIVGEKEYVSASEALLAYIQQFEPGDGKQSGVPLAAAGGKRSPSASLQAEVQDALREAKLKRLLKESQVMQMSKAKQSNGSSSNNNNSNNNSLRQEVDEALTRSADLLDRIKSDNSPPHCVSSIGSLSTDALLSVDAGAVKQGHIYSYRRNRSSSVPARSMTVFTPIQEQYTPRSSSRSPPPSSRTPRTGTPRSGGRSVTETAASSLARLRSRSVSPSLLQPPSKSPRTPSWLEDLDTPVMPNIRGRDPTKKSVPSWVDDLNTSGLSSAVSRGRPQSRQQAPSWVLTAAEKSDIASTSSVVGGLDLGLPSHNTTADSRPGLNYSDLYSMEGGAQGGEGIARVGKESPRHRSQSPRGKSVTFDPGLRDVSANDSDLDRSRQRHAASKAAELKAKLDRYIEEFDFNKLMARGGQAGGSGVEGDNSEPKGSNSDLEALPRCSSMDTVALMAGNLGPGSHISGASPILKASDLDDNAGARAKGHGSGAASINTDLILDGDRPWEKTAAYKDPVLPGTDLNLSPEDGLRLSGSGQPGSMEALKNMYFRLQAEEHNSSRDPDSMMQGAGAGNGGELPLPALKGYDFMAEPGGHSLERALVHLSRLKTLVQSNDKAGSKTS